MVVGKLLLGSLALLVFVSVPRTDACSCIGSMNLCDYIEDAAVVLRAKVLSSSREGEDINDNVNYDVETIDVYKGEPGAEYGDDVHLTFTTGGNSALCGIYLEVGQEYLLDLVRYEWDDNSLWSAGSCGGMRLWSSVTEVDLVFLDDPSKCDLEDRCLAEPCGEFQDCLPWEIAEPYSYGGYQYPEEYYCADRCDLGRCPEGEECDLVATPCAAEGIPCPPVAVCSPVAGNPCEGACDVYQECRLYLNNGKWYCSDRCYDGACATGETCVARKRSWCRGNGSGCPKKLVCLTPD